MLPLVLPDLPGSVAGVPQRIEQVLVPERVHALPEALVLEGHQLALLREGLFCVRYRFTDITPKRKKPGMCGLRVPNMPG